VKDFIANSVFMLIEPHMYLLKNEGTNLNNIFSVRYVPGDYSKAKRITAYEFRQFFPDDVFAFNPVQNIIQSEESFKTWKEFRNIVLFFALLSILISSVGLFGLVMFFSKQKMKEIGIRKILGFSVGWLYMKLLSEFIGLLLISIVIAWPIAWYVYKLLPGAYKYPLGIWEFISATGIILLVAVITISYHLIKSTRANPAEILKYE
jgi:putative ABC transport system permease protein